jgi:hypothetical protein
MPGTVMKGVFAVQITYLLSVNNDNSNMLNNHFELGSPPVYNIYRSLLGFIYYLDATVCWHDRLN